MGAGLDFVGPDSGHPDPVTQSGNVFDSNSLVALSGAGNYGGGGEWLEGASLTSVADRFSRNFVAGTTGANWSWAAGLGIVNPTCSALAPTESTLENAVVEGNSLGPGTPEDIGGSGIYLGCGPSPANPNHLTLLDSTVTGNSTAGGIAGIEGDTADQLVLANSIVAGDTGGPETGGFDGPGASVSATYSDVCAGSSPLSGVGNMCANPLLADNGSPASFDVHETAASPTIDAGSNALVPAGLGRDVFGAPRIAATIIEAGCGQGYHRPAVVDMGANEFAGSIIRPGGAGICPPVLFRSQFSFPSISVRANGLLILAFKGLATGHVSVLATFKLTHTVLQRIKGRLRRVRKVEAITYGAAAHSSTRAGSFALALKPTKRALGLLKSHRRLRVTLKVTFRAAGALASAQTHTPLIAYKAPPKRRHR
ncbi:MAG TPA: hypothetical protein VF380_03945 [Solirubrobacteraceae bacterium]